MLLDAHGRIHDYLRISLTERCNLRCFYCMPEEGIEKRPREVFMRTEELLGIVETFARLGVRKVRLTGGEPLVRKDAGAILRAISGMGLQPALTTNGILIDQHIDDFHAAGLRAINVSLDSLDHAKQARIARRDYFKRIMDNIQLLIDEGIEVKVNAVIIQGVNADELGGFVSWTRAVPVHVRFIEFMPFEGNHWDWSRKVSAAEMLDAIEAHVGPHALQALPAQAHDTSRNFRVAGHAGTFGFISPVTNPFCDSCNRIRLTADGRIKNCLFSLEETDILGPLRQGHDLEPIIRGAILAKAPARGGMSSFELEGMMHQNRSMITIGG